VGTLDENFGILSMLCLNYMRYCKSPP